MQPFFENKLDTCLSFIAAQLRRQEANLSRGQVQKLEELDRMSDLNLLRKWSWTSGIVGALFSFCGLPLFLLAVGSVLPQPALTALWLITEIMMGATGALLSSAVYLTLGRQD